MTIWLDFLRICHSFRRLNQLRIKKTKYSETSEVKKYAGSHFAFLFNLRRRETLSIDLDRPWKNIKNGSQIDGRSLMKTSITMFKRILVGRVSLLRALASMCFQA